jgi:hypothetical protein
MYALKHLGLVIILLMGAFNSEAQTKTIKIGSITNEIQMGKFAGNRNLAFGVQNILEEYLMDSEYELTDDSTTQLDLKLVYFDIKNIGASLGIYHKDVSLTQIIAIGELKVNGKVVKTTMKKGESKEISTSTLIVADDGTFNQQTASIALKKLCKQIVEDLLQ